MEPMSGWSLTILKSCFFGRIFMVASESDSSEHFRCVLLFVCGSKIVSPCGKKGSCSEGTDHTGNGR